MSIYFSSYSLNTYQATPYFQAHLPPDYPLSLVLQASRAFRRLPPNLRHLAELSKEWAVYQSVLAGDPIGGRGIDDWYDAEGYELDPDTGLRLTDAEIDAQWGPVDPDLARSRARDIPVSAGGFPDPATWKPPLLAADPVIENRPSKYQLLRDIALRGRRYTARYYGISEADLPTEDSGLTGAEAKEIFKLHSWRVIHSDYFTEARYNEADFLSEAFEGADVYSDLGGRAKDIFDRAEETMEHLVP